MQHGGKSLLRASIILTTITTLSFSYLSSHVVSADDSVVSNVSLSVPVSCNMTSTVDTPHTATINPGTYRQNIGTTTFNVLCNDPNGFALYAIGYTDDTYGKTTLTATISGAIDHTYDISTSTATSGATSSWSMKILKDGTPNNITIDNSYDNYNVIPTEYTKVASFTPTTTELVSQGAIKSTYASYMSTTQHTGTYDGKVKYTLVHPNNTDAPTPPCPGNTICYNDNGASSPTTMDDQTISSGATTIDLWPSNFQRAGYGFAGWNTKKDGSGTSYGPMETIDAPSEFAASGLILYAMWIAPPATNNTLQGWTGCSTMSTGQVTALTDTRDNNVYAVAKLADGNCWMIENLRLGGSSSMNLTTANTVTAFTLPASTNTFQTSNYTTVEMSAKNTLETASNMTTPTDAEVYSYGNYYSWPAAIGSTTAYSTNNQSVSTSICPSGWHLPKGGDSSNTSNSEFYKLGTAIMNNTAPNVANGTRPYYDNNVTNTAGKTATAAIRSYPNNFLYSGFLSGSSFYSRGFSGYYWSSTVGSSNDSYFLDFHSSNVGPGTYYGGKYRGFSVRCVIAPPVTISDAYAKAGKTKQNGYYKMQDMSDSICGMVNVLDESGQTQLIDTRDNKIYWATKLQDDKCWMTQNLDHDISTTFAYTPDNTDIPANWTPDKPTYATGTKTWDSSNTGNNIQQSYDPGDKIWDGVTNSSGLTLGNMTQGTNQHYHLGNYYNWGAAVAMNNTSSYTTQNTDINQSICPKGWMLPKSGNITTAGSFQYLVNQYNWASNSMTNPNIWQAPPYFPLSGYWGGSSHFVASDGYFWSSVVYSSYGAYYLWGNYNGYVDPVDGVSRYYGYSVRCVSR